MTSKLNLISQAYFQLGKKRLLTLDVNSDLDMGASDVYDLLIPSVISNFDFYFTRKYASLAKNAVAPDDLEYASSFALPNDFISMLQVKGTLDYKIMGLDIWTNESELNIDYVTSASESLFPPSFSLYIVYLLCEHLAYQITNDINLVQLWTKKAMYQFGVVGTVMTGQETNKTIEYDSLIVAHNS